MAIGVVAALQKVGLAGTVPVSGQDGDEANLNNVAKGLQTVDVWKDAFALGETAGNAAIQLCNKARRSPTSRRRRRSRTTSSRPRRHRGSRRRSPTPGWRTTVVKSIILNPTPVTAENLNVPLDLGLDHQGQAVRRSRRRHGAGRLQVVDP